MTLFIKQKQGSVTTLMALMAMTLVVAGGVAVDITNAVTVKAHLRDKLDSAALSAAQQALSTDGAQAEITKFLKEEFDGKLSVTASESFTAEARNLSVTAEFDVPTFVLGVIGSKMNKVNLAATVSVPLHLTEFRVRSSFVQGDYNKVMSFMVRRPQAAEDLEIARFEYFRSTGEMTGPTGWIEVGPYEHAYFKMEIDPNSLGFAENCGSCPTMLRTDRPENSNRIFIDNKQLPLGTTLHILETVRCGSAMNHGWEDGGWHETDFRYVVDAECDVTPSKTMRLSR